MVGVIVAGNAHINLEKAKQAYSIPKVADILDKLFAKASEDSQ